MGYVYILKSNKGKFYVGSTNDLKRRFEQHISGYTHTTARMEKLELVFSQEYESLEKARYVELKLKKLKMNTSCKVTS